MDIRKRLCGTSATSSIQRCSRRWQTASTWTSLHTRQDSGPSIDRSRGYRSLQEVQKRGQWKSQKSVTRYEKSARLASTWEKNSTNPPFPLPGVRRRPWGVPARKAGISRVPAKRRGQYVMDLFSGEGGVSKACIKLGFNAKQWAIKYGSCHDLTDPKVVRRIITEIKAWKGIERYDGTSLHFIQCCKGPH